MKKHWKWMLVSMSVVGLGLFLYVSSDFYREGQERKIHEAMFRHQLLGQTAKANLSINDEPISEELLEQLSEIRSPICTGVKTAFSVDSEGVIGRRIEDAETGEEMVEYNIVWIKWVDRSTVHVRSSMFGGLLYGYSATYTLSSWRLRWVVTTSGYDVIVS